MELATPNGDEWPLNSRVMERLRGEVVSGDSGGDELLFLTVMVESVVDVVSVRMETSLKAL
jgi:hypothetical protein